MNSLNIEILQRGEVLALGLRREGRRDEADTVDALLRIVQQNEPGPQYLTTGQVASRLGVTRQTIVNWVKQARLPGLRIGGRVMIPATALAPFARIEQLLDELDAQRQPPTSNEIAELVSRERVGWTWQGKDTHE